MERRGNNGTTAYDFEFNQEAPDPNSAFPGYIPNRTQGDILFTFEISGSGSSGSAVGYVFSYNAVQQKYLLVSPAPAGLVASINNSINTPAPPWGHVSGQGNWVGGNLERFEFGEAKAPLSLLPGVNSCGGSAYVQLRTRSSSTENSDLKDTTKIFQFEFGGPSTSGSLTPSCDLDFGYSAVNATGGTGPYTYNWQFQKSTDAGTTWTNVGSPVTGQTSTYTAPSAGLYRGVLSVTDGNGCTSVPVNTSAIQANSALAAQADLTPQCSNTFGYASSNISGGSGAYSYNWVFQKNSLDDGTGNWSNVANGTSTTASGNFTASVPGRYRGILTVTDTANTACVVSDTSNETNVYSPVGGTATLTGDCDDIFAYSATGSGGKAPYTFNWTIQKWVGGTWVSAHTFSSGPAASSSGTLDVDSFTTGANGDGRYRALVTIRDSQTIVCDVVATSNEIDVAHELSATASKTGANGSTYTVTVTGVPANAVGATRQWQYLNGATWTNIAGASSDTLLYTSANFEAHTTSVASSFTIATGNAAAGNYEGQLWTVQLRLKLSRTLNESNCEAFSNPVTVKMVRAVDP